MSLRRGAVIAIILGAHAGIVLLLLEAMRSSRQPEASAFESAVIALPAAAPASRPETWRRPKLTEPEPLGPAESAMPGEAAAPIDWSDEAAAVAAAAASAAPKPRAFGETPQAPAWLRSSRSSPRHRAGDQYRLETGEAIVWVSDRCYVVSEPPALGVPDVYARSLGTRTVCQAPPGPPSGELFRALPKYRQLHPQ